MFAQLPLLLRSQGDTWDVNQTSKLPPIGTLGHPDTLGWDDGDGFFGESSTIVLRNDSKSFVHAGRLGTAYNTPGLNFNFDECA